MKRSIKTVSLSDSLENTGSIPKTASGKAKISSLATVIIALILVTACILGIKSIWFSGTEKKSTNQEQASVVTKENLSDLIGKVAKHISINTAEEPTVATIQDADLLRMQNPVFYKDAQNGDRLLVWSDKAILYSTSKDQLLYVLPINLSTTTANNAKVTSSTITLADTKEAATIEVRNGTLMAGLARTMSEKIKKAGLSVLQISDAKLKNYDTTIIIKNSDKDFPQTFSILEAVTGAKQSTLPEGEKASTADILIILGNDFKE